MRAFTAKLRELHADITISAWPDSRIHIMMGLSGATVRVGFPMNRQNYLAHERTWRKKQLRIGCILNSLASIAMLRPLLTQKVNRLRYSQAHLDDWRQLAEQLEIPWNLSTPWLATDPEVNAARDDALKMFLTSAHRSGDKVWLIHPGARLPSKRWPVERFQALIDVSFASPNMPLVVIQPPDGPCPEVHNDHQMLIETRTIQDLLFVLDHVDNVVCNDSLTSHLAAALGKKVITVFGSGDPNWFAPHGNQDLVVRAHACDYHPCMDCCEMPTYVCLDAVTVDMVQEAIGQLMRQ